ncbi:MAG: hypothetical protein COB49_01995 [Alphaproteobacteria bacterium]|nr:MAG: hypothetical protein COB49_01995 [Alphaproteobacteria bacterium]
MDAPADDAFAIAPDDANELPFITRSIHIGGDGNLVLVTKKGTTVTFVGLKAGTTLPIRAKQVNLTGTTATNLVGLV